MEPIIVERCDYCGQRSDDVDMNEVELNDGYRSCVLLCEDCVSTADLAEPTGSTRWYWLSFCDGRERLLWVVVVQAVSPHEALHIATLAGMRACGDVVIERLREQITRGASPRLLSRKELGRMGMSVEDLEERLRRGKRSRELFKARPIVGGMGR